MVKRVLMLTFLMALSTLVGCHKRSAKNLVPSQEQAKQALQIALDSWKANGKSDQSLSIPNGPTVLAIDTDWRDGKKLQAYEIVGEEPVQAGEPKKFKVKLTYEGQSPQETIYHVVGNNPLRIFRNEDYKNATGMGAAEQ